MSNTPKVSLRGLYKIFGPKDKAMMTHVKAGMGKPELLEQHRHVLGLQDINVDMQEGEITVVLANYVPKVIRAIKLTMNVFLPQLIR